MHYSNEKEYWVVGYSETWGRWQVRRRDIDNEAYQLVEDLGPNLLTATIEFDGDFILGEFAPHVEEITSGLPWLFVVTTDGKLYVKQVKADMSTAVLLDTNVEKISACLGFKSVVWGVDQGLIIAYIKTGGTAWHQERLPNQQGQLTWTGAIQISDAGSGNTNIQVFRLLDYRIGIYVGGVNKLYISERDYIGNTIKSEKVYSNASLPFVVTPFRDETHDATADFEILTITRYNSTTVQVHANYPVFDYDSSWDDIYVTQGAAGQYVDYLEWADGDLFIHLVQEITSLSTVTFKCRWDNRKGYYVSANCMPVWPEITFTLRPQSIDMSAETVASSTAITTILRMRGKMIYPIEFEEYVYGTAQISTTLVVLPIVYTDVIYKPETVSATAAITTALTMLQTGVSPI